MLLFHLLAMSMQIQGWFRFNDVKHLLNTGASTRHSFSQGMLQTTDIPDECVVLCMTNTGTHGFLHNESAICRCFWEKRAKMSIFHKIEVVKELLLWLDGKKSYEHNLSKEEDATIFEMAKNALGMHKDEDIIQS
mgnify:CR=1 FL=1